MGTIECFACWVCQWAAGQRAEGMHSTSAHVITNVLSTRDCSPWRPAAVMSMAAHDNHQFPQIFTGCRERTRGVALYQACDM